MNIAIDIRSLMTKQRTGVGEYTYELLDAVFLNTNTEDAEKKEDTENIEINQYFLFYNSYKDVSENIPKWEYDNVHYVCTRMPNKLFSLLTWLSLIKLDQLILRNLKTQKHKNTKTQKQPSDTLIDYFFAPNINFLSLSRKTKLILTVHDLSFELLPECYTWKRRLWHKVLRPKKMCRRANIILTPSENTKRDVVREWGIETEKVKVLQPGLCSHITYHMSHIIDRKIYDVKRKYNLPEKYILYLGTIEPRKNILGIIQAYKKSSLLGEGYMLIIAGASGWKNEEIFKAIENTAGVKYIGYVDDEDKTILYKNSSLFVFPSLFEGFGLPVLEALACDTPVITSDRSSLSEIFGDFVYLANPNNIIEIGSAMKKILSGKLEFKKIDLEKFSWNTSAEKFLDLTKE